MIKATIAALLIFITGASGTASTEPKEADLEQRQIIVENIEEFERIDIYEEVVEVEPVEEVGPTFIYLGEYKVTGYDNCSGCCGKWAGGPTASGVMPEAGRTVAMCSNYPFGTRIYIEGLGYYTVEDRGVSEGKVDIYVNNHAEAYALTGWYDVWEVVE